MWRYEYRRPLVWARMRAAAATAKMYRNELSRGEGGTRLRNNYGGEGVDLTPGASRASVGPQMNVPGSGASRGARPRPFSGFLWCAGAA